MHSRNDDLLLQDFCMTARWASALHNHNQNRGKKAFKCFSFLCERLQRSPLRLSILAPSWKLISVYTETHRNICSVSATTTGHMRTNPELKGCWLYLQRWQSSSLSKDNIRDGICFVHPTLGKFEYYSGLVDTEHQGQLDPKQCFRKCVHTPKMCKNIQKKNANVICFLQSGHGSHDKCLPTTKQSWRFFVSHCL